MDRAERSPRNRPSRITSDLLWDHEDPEAVAQLVADAIRPIYDYPGTFATASHPMPFGSGCERATAWRCCSGFLT